MVDFIGHSIFIILKTAACFVVVGVVYRLALKMISPLLRCDVMIASFRVFYVLKNCRQN